MRMRADLYDLTSPFVEPTAQTTARTQPQTRRASDKLMEAMASLLVFAVLLYVAALLCVFSPLGNINADVGWLLVAVTVTVLGAIVVRWVRG